MAELCLLTNMSSSEVASWAQFAGGLLAVGAAISVPYIQRWLDRETTRRRALQLQITRLEAVLAFTGQIRGQLAKIGHQVTANDLRYQPYNEIGILTRQLQSAANELGAAPVFDLGDTEAAGAIFDLRQIISVTADAILATKKEPAAFGNTLRQLDVLAVSNMVDIYREKIKESIGRMRELPQRRNGRTALG